MKKINTLCEWQDRCTNQSTLYGQLEVGIGTFGMIVIAIISLFFKLPLWALIIIGYKPVTAALFLVSLAVRPKNKRDSSFQTIAICLHFIDVFLAAPFLKKNKNPHQYI